MDLKFFFLKKSSFSKNEFKIKSKSECQSPVHSSKASTIPPNSHVCSPNNIVLKPPGLEGPSFQLSASFRFSDIYVPVVRKRLTPTEFTNINQRIQINKQIAKLLPAERLETKKLSTKKNNFRGEINRIAKISIATKRKHSIQEDLQQKSKKFEYRTRASEVQELKKTWFSLFCSIGIGFVIQRLTINRNKLRKRSMFKLL